MHCSHFLIMVDDYLINGQNIGQDIFEASGQSQFAQDFYHNYLHANYISDVGPTFFLRGIDGDPISNQINFRT